MGRRLLLLGALLGLAGPAWGQDDGDAALREELAGLTRAFEAAFNGVDAVSMSELFTDDARLITDEGEAIVGKKAIAERFLGVLSASPGVKIACETTWVERLGADTAIEEGIATLQTNDPQGPSEAVPYVAVYVKRDGGWKHRLVRDLPHGRRPGAEGRRAALAGLSFLEGDWVGESPDGLLVVNGKHEGDFIELTYALQVEGEPRLTGEFRIGWDASAGRLRAWEFNSIGAFGEGTWTPLGENRWLTQSTLTSAEGDVTQATRILERLDAHRLSWRRIDGDAPMNDSIILTWRPPLPGTGVKPGSLEPETPR